MQFFSLGRSIIEISTGDRASSIMEISETNCFDIMTIHNDQISDLQGLPQKKIHAPTTKKSSIFVFIKYNPYRKKKITHIYCKKSFRQPYDFLVHELHF